MNATRYLETLEMYMVRTHNIRGNHHLLQDRAPCHKAKKNIAWLREEGIETNKWSGNSPYANPIENLWHIAENYLEKRQCKNVEEMKREIRHLWQNDITREYCRTQARSMPNRLQAVFAANGGHTKYWGGPGVGQGVKEEWGQTSNNNYIYPICKWMSFSTTFRPIQCCLLAQDSPLLYRYLDSCWPLARIISVCLNSFCCTL